MHHAADDACGCLQVMHQVVRRFPSTYILPLLVFSLLLAGSITGMSFFERQLITARRVSTFHRRAQGVRRMSTDDNHPQLINHSWVRIGTIYSLYELVF
jgi:hypothetical protein